MQTARCLVCNSDIIIEDEMYEGDLVSCSICSRDLEIISLHPVRLAVINDEDKNSGVKDKQAETGEEE
ncbi:hypothetical protein KKG24_04550 [Patescibacteria group bacterium]|nr:hypothetical protein [Patescibacteria group bacterium]